MLAAILAIQFNSILSYSVAWGLVYDENRMVDSLFYFWHTDWSIYLVAKLAKTYYFSMYYCTVSTWSPLLFSHMLKLLEWTAIRKFGCLICYSQQDRALKRPWIGRTSALLLQCPNSRLMNLVQDTQLLGCNSATALQSCNPSRWTRLESNLDSRIGHRSSVTEKSKWIDIRFRAK